jgi:hypothetical protein
MPASDRHPHNLSRDITARKESQQQAPVLHRVLRLELPTRRVGFSVDSRSGRSFGR